jgi:uncharacterized membrane protein
MSSSREKTPHRAASGAGTGGTARASDESAEATPVLEENIEAIKRWEQTLRHERSRAERLDDWITSAAASGPALAAHVGWFAFWILANVGAIPAVPRFDPFPFPFLTMTVSLEAIFLALFVLASQNRLARQSDKRSHLDLQVDLLAEREMTAVLRLLQDLTTHLGVKVSVTPAQLRDMAKKTDIPRLAQTVDLDDDA